MSASVRYFPRNVANSNLKRHSHPSVTDGCEFWLKICWVSPHLPRLDGSKSLPPPPSDSLQAPRLPRTPPSHPSKPRRHHRTSGAATWSTHLPTRPHPSGTPYSPPAPAYPEPLLHIPPSLVSTIGPAVPPPVAVAFAGSTVVEATPRRCKRRRVAAALLPSWHCRVCDLVAVTAFVAGAGAAADATVVEAPPRCCNRRRVAAAPLPSPPSSPSRRCNRRRAAAASLASPPSSP